jgi:hypothetical protein
MSKSAIGWQKYEDLIQKQLTSPFASLMLQSQMNISEQDFPNLDEDDEISFSEMLESEEKDLLVVPVPQDFHNQISLVTNYDCWVGHTNFDITEEVRDIIDTCKGVEILKVHSRYRFFVGIGRMFDFSEVRQLIEESLTSED